MVEVPDADEAYDGPLNSAPLMVTIGHPEDDAELYLDLEVDGLLALTGDLEVAMNLARSVVTELTLSPLAATLRRSEERRVGKEGVSTCRTGVDPYHYKKKIKQLRGS